MKCRWLHNHPEYPILYFSELDQARYEVRKVVVYRNGRMGFASQGASSNERTPLGEKEVPPATETAADPQFALEPLNAAEFEDAWRAAKVGRSWKA